MDCFKKILEGGSLGVVICFMGNAGEEVSGVTPRSRAQATR